MEETSMYYKNEHFECRTDVKVCIREKTIRGSYYEAFKTSMFLITDIPSAQGRYVLKIEHISN